MTESPYLDTYGIERALAMLRDDYPEPWTLDHDDQWRDVLCQLKRGELRAHLAGYPPNSRPDAYAFLDGVLKTRRMNALAAEIEAEPVEPPTDIRRLNAQRKPPSYGSGYLALLRVKAQHFPERLSDDERLALGL
jgi:hypothetical protein